MELNTVYPNDFLNKKRRIRQNTCFIIMPFGEETKEVYETIKRAATYCQVDCERSDELKKSSPFINKIISSINTSYFLIVDISGLNPNVFYELGIAHTLRSVNRVLILKDSTTKCPSDIGHINYFSYEKGKYFELYDHVVNFIKNNNCLEDLGDLFIFFNLVTDETDLAEIVNDVKVNLADYSSTLVNLLNNTIDELSEEEIYILLKNLHKRIFSFRETDKYSVKHFYINLITHLLYRMVKDFDIEDNINRFFANSTIQQDKYLLEVQSDIAATLVKIKYYESAFIWVKKYLMTSFPASVDITKYKLQVALLNSRLNETNQFLLDNLSENVNNLGTKPIRSLVEHSLNLCREKEIVPAIPIAMKYVETTKDEFIFRSAVDLIVRLGTAEQIIELLKITDKRSELIEKSSFLNDHIENANIRLLSLKNS